MEGSIRPLPDDKRGKNMPARPYSVYRAVFESSEDAIILVQPGGTIRYCNEAACRMFGYSREEMSGLKAAGLLPDQVAAILPDTITKDSTTGGTFVWRSCRKKDGSIIPARISSRLIKAGRQRLVLVCVRGLLIRKSGRLQESPVSDRNERELPVYTITWQSVGDDFVMVGCNMATEDFTKVAIKDFIGKKASELYSEHPDIFEDMKSCFVRKSLFRRQMPYRMFTTGEERDMHATYMYTEPGLIIMHLRDVTEQAESIRALQQSEQRMASLFCCMPVPTITWKRQDEEFVLMDFNLAAQEMTRGMISEHVGVPASRIYSDRPDILADLKKCFEQRVIIKREMDYTMFTTGAAKVLALTCAFIPPDLVMFHMDDITARKKAEKELWESERRLKLLSSQLLSREEKVRQGIALELHDSIGQYLSSIKFNAETGLTRMTALGSAECIEFLKSGIPIIQRAIEEVRRISMDLRPSILDDLGILATLSWFCREFENVYKEIKVEKVVDIEENEIPECLKIIIYRVLQEAFNNTAKHSRASRVTFSLSRVGESIKLMVSDNGTGFDMAGVGLREGISRGLGLASMRERVELSGGIFKIETGTGRGTIILATWPV